MVRRSEFSGFLESFEGRDAQIAAAMRGGQPLGVEQRVESEAIHDGADLHCQAAAFLDRCADKLREERVDFCHGAAEAHLVVEFAQPFALLRMADDVELELQIEHEALLIVQQFFQVPCEDVNALIEIGRRLELFDYPALVARNVFFEDCEEDVFFVTEVVVEGAARLAGFGCDVFNAGRFEAISSKDFPCRLHQLLARN